MAAVQQVLKNAGLAEIDGGTNAVSGLMNALSDSGYTQVSTPSAGDIVILVSSTGVGEHAGIMESNTEMISNSSSSGHFNWTGTPGEEEGIDAQQVGYTPATPLYFAHNP
ncbi:MAG: hypothetical protein ACYCUI_16620 [Vulcanimicrobiaceae bacterium]